MPPLTDRPFAGFLLKPNQLTYLLLITLGMAMIFIAALYPPPLSGRETETTSPRYSGVRFPSNYRTEFAHYATVQRSDGTIRDLYINPEAITRIREGSYRLPENTIIVIEGHYALTDSEGSYQFDSQGRYLKDQALEMIHVIEKRSDWEEADFVSDNRIGDWNFGSFDASGGYFDENMSACFHCHNATAQTDFVYSARLLGQYIRTSEVQFLLCDLPDRIAC